MTLLSSPSECASTLFGQACETSGEAHGALLSSNHPLTLGCIDIGDVSDVHFPVSLPQRYRANEND
jgi:hypothetical protein